LLVVDNYIIPKSKKTQKALDRYADRRIVMLLPTYSPQLNAIELLWKYLRREVTHNHLFASVTELIEAVEAFFARRDQMPERVLCVIGAKPVPENLCGAIYQQTGP
jgi:putative transposase